ncbi:unnamed protein product [Bemisia tabaci]|uniref:Glutamate-rich protein 2 n=1 Tax=Bemisia tabaci TaxID=7038 RepID=A0A9P0AHR7_BEMTA|nr:unnamed protein product [Bemisia tabaci]
MNDDEINGNSSTSEFSIGNISLSNDDVSEYTDADESISAPTELLSEFLSSVMMKNYHSAFKYCKLILQYEPNHSTAKEFLPLLQEKCNQNKDDNDDDTLDDSGDDTSDISDTESEGIYGSNEENSRSCHENGKMAPPKLLVKETTPPSTQDLSSSGTGSELERGGTTTSYSSLDGMAEIQYDQMNDESLSNTSLVESFQKESSM